MCAVAYRVSCVLYHSGISGKDATRLNRLGICVSPNSIISLHHKMGENFDHKVSVWKKAIKENWATKNLLEEVKEKQSSIFDMEIDVDLDEAKLREYKWYSHETYKKAMASMEAERKLKGGRL